MVPVKEPNVQASHITADMKLDDEDIVISGMSTVLPGCHNVAEFAERLYNKENMVCGMNPRWQSTYPELPKHHGFIPKLDRFDPQFFMVYYALSTNMDVITRKLLEHSYQALYDAGVCSTELSGKRVAVFMAGGVSESDKAVAYSTAKHGILGSNKAMYANRISYYLNLKGPSIFMQGDGCGSFIALEQAYFALNNGHCEAALVGSANLLLHPQTSFHYHKMVRACPDGKVKSYDVNADGQSLSEGINVLFLQKKKHARRMYARICHIKTEFSMQKEGMNSFGPYRDPPVLTKFLRDFYDEANISPSSVEYVEGFGAALPETDKAELQVMEEMFCKDRKKPLLVGSVTSNVGCTDSASGITGVIKVLLAYQSGVLAGNINCENPRRDITALRDGRMRILTDHHEFQRTYAAVNSLSITGINGHILLHGCYKPKDIQRYSTDLPYLVTVSGRQESCVEKIFDDIKKRPLDPEFIALLHSAHRIRIPKHLARGFSIFASKGNKAVALREKVDYHDEVKRPLWFVYTGMGSQWAGMGTQLMKLPIFAEAIQRCHRILEPKGVDVINIITSTDITLFDNVLNSFVGIAAIQIGLTDVLHAVGLVPDNIIGHSLGEIGCAYADGSCTDEEMMLIAYYRGLVSIETPFIKGSMAAVGIGYKQISKMIPAEIEVACRNGPTTSTISGPVEIMKEFVAKLTAEGIFAKEVQCSNIAYHSRYIAEAGPKLLKYLTEIGGTPKRRSKKWISTSYPEELWNTPGAKYSSPEYHTNNLLSPVFFEETLKHVPINAVLVEIAPHGLLQAILKRSLTEDKHCIPLTKRGHEDNTIFLLQALGKLYLEGFDMDLSVLYPKIEFPISTETQSLSHLVEWYHGDKLKVSQYVGAHRYKQAIYRSIITVYDEENYYLKGHRIEGVRVFPYAGALIAVWDTLAMTIGKPKKNQSVQFYNIQFFEQPPLYDDTSLHLSVLLQRGSGRFEVTYEYGLVAEGHIKLVNKFSQPPRNTTVDSDLSQEDVYRLFYEKGYQYTGEFRSIKSANFSLNRALVTWQNNWVTFLDGVFQLNYLMHPHTGISKPQYIRQLNIDVKKHNLTETGQMNSLIAAEYNEVYERTICGGVTIEQMRFKECQAIIRHSAGLKELCFFPFFQEENIDILTSLYVFLQIISENLNKKKLKIFYVSDPRNVCLLDRINRLLNSPPKLSVIVDRINTEDIQESNEELKKLDVIFVDNLLSDKKVFESLYHAVPSDTFIISLGVETEDKYPSSLYRRISAVGKEKSRMELAQYRPSKPYPTTAALTVKTSSDLEFLKATRKDLPKGHKLLILTSYPAPVELKELVHQWKSGSGSSQINVLMINDDSVYDDLENMPNYDLAYTVINRGILGGEYYMPIRDSKERSSRVETEGVASLHITQLGDLNSLHWEEIPESAEPGISVKVHYAGLSVYDAKKATAEISAKHSTAYGMDYSGVTQRGDRVMGIVKRGAASERVKALPELMWPVPAHWTLEDAATVPSAYAHAFYCYTIRIKTILCPGLKPGTSVLVHGGTGALGQAAIAIALGKGCNVFATVSDIHKKRFLMRLFPKLKANHIGNSRDSTFEEMIQIETNGLGCKIVLCCLNGTLKDISLKCSALLGGVTLDVGQLITKEKFKFQMTHYSRDRSYISVDFNSIFDHIEEMKMIQKMITEGIAQGYVRPLSRITYEPHEVSRAFRLLASSRHRGRVLLNLNEDLPNVQQRIICLPGNCQLIICDDDGFGLQLADRLVSNGARKLYLHVPQNSNYFELKVRKWQMQGVQVYKSCVDLSRRELVQSLFKDVNNFAAVEGIYIITSGFAKHSRSRAKEIVSNLESASREHCHSLRHFVLINEDNTIGHEISLARNKIGLPALSIQLNNMEKFEGYNANIIGNANEDTLKWSTALNAIERASRSKKAVVLAYVNPLARRSLLEEVAALPGVSITSATADKDTLEQVGLDYGRAQDLSYLLKEKFNITLAVDSIPSMKIADLKKLHDDTVKKPELTGFGAHFNHVETDELMCNNSMVLMRTLIHTNEMRTDEFSSDIPYLCIVPGLEGCYQRFDVLCERLKIAAVVLQPGLDVVDETIEHLAHRFIDVMMLKMKLKHHFHLLGYETGVFVALEMAAILERRGFTGTVHCLGGTPEDIRSTIKMNLGNAGAKQQDDLIKHMFTLMTKLPSDKLQLKDSSTWNEKLDTCLKAMRGNIEISMQYARATIEAAYARIKLAYQYAMKPQRLRSEIVILRAKLPTSSIDFCSKSNLSTHELDATLSRAPKDLRCPAIINKYLEPEILADYYNRNHCDTCLLDCAMITYDYLDD